MKAILAVLLCYVLFASECFAHKGGPFEGRGGSGAAFPTTGTFAGVLMPAAAENSIGVFTVVFPTTGLSTGVLVIFQTGQTYVGTVQGLIDPKGGAVHAVLYATFPIAGADNAVAVASGQWNGKVTAAFRLNGIAKVQFSRFINQIDSEVTYNVSGFKQA